MKVTSRLKDSPAIISSHESGALRRMMRMVEQQNSGAAAAMPKQKIEVNPKCVESFQRTYRKCPERER